MNLSRVASGLPQYSRNITGSGRLTAIWPVSPIFSGFPAASMTATVWPATGLPIALGLPVEFIDHQAECRFAPFVSFRPKRLSSRADRTHANGVAAFRVRRCAQHAQRGRRDEGVSDL